MLLVPYFYRKEENTWDIEYFPTSMILKPIFQVAEATEAATCFRSESSLRHEQDMCAGFSGD
jgi:hypothetical protein